MLFPAKFYGAIQRGEITVAYRRWKRAAARVDGRHRIDVNGLVEITSVDIVDAKPLTDADARAAGYDGRAVLMRELNRYDDGVAQIYRIEFRYIREADPRMALGANDDLSPEEVASIRERLARLDAVGRDGPWTRATLAIIEQQPGVLAGELAEQLGREKLSFKSDVRKLKALGLTFSREIGYEISPRGRAVLRMIDQATG